MSWVHSCFTRLFHKMLLFETNEGLEDLPHVVVEKLLSYLDFHDRLTLRLVCKTTQDWIETSKVLGGLNDDPFLKTLDNCKHHSTTVQEWIHDGSYPWPSSRLSISTIRDFPIDHLCQIGSSVRFLTLESFSGSPTELSFLSCCTNLQSLTIQSLDLTSKQNLVEIEAALVKDIFWNLEHFDMDQIAVLYPPDFTLINYYKKMITLMRNLNTLKVPKVVESTGKTIESGMNFSLHLGFVVGPLLAYLNERTEDDPSTYLKALDLSNLDPLISSFFKEILKPCSTMKTRVYNVHYSLIKLVAYDGTDLSLLRCVHSVRNKFEGVLTVLEELKNIRSIKIDCDCVTGALSIPSELKTKFENTVLFPCLEHAELCLWSETRATDLSEEQKMDKQLIESILFTRDRPNLRQLSLVGVGRSHLLYDLSDLLGKFGNVTVLKIQNFPKFTNEDFKAVLKNMKQLHVLEIEDEWGALSDAGITTPAEDSADVPYELLTMKSLVKLKITGTYKYTGGFYPQGQSYQWHWSRLEKFSSAPNQNFISDYSFKEVFSRMRLRSFLVQTADIHITKLAYYFLLKGEFASHVEYFPHPDYLPLGLTSMEFYEIRNEFKHFREENRISSAYQQLSSIFNYPSDFRPRDEDSGGCLIS